MQYNNIKDKSKLVDLTLSNRKEFAKLIFAACIIAMGTSLIANFITDCFKSSLFLTFLIGVGLIIIATVYFIYIIISEAKNEVEINALLAIDYKPKRVFPILRYEFAEKLESTLTAVFLENEALKIQWEDDFKNNESNDDQSNENESSKNKPISQNTKEKVEYFSIIEISSKDSKNGKSKSDKMLEEAVEFILLDELSTHLSTYFNNYSEHDKLIKVYTRSDFPKILLQNRIINLLSAPFEDRAIFAKAGMTTKPPEGEIVSIYGTDGSNYSRFHLSLPQGSVVSRPSDGILTVENSRIFMRIEINYDGFGTVLPMGFEHNYLGLERGSLGISNLRIKLNYKIKPLSLLYRSSWNYHSWIDSFVERLIELGSFSDFVNRINWETNLTSIITQNQRYKRLNIKNEDQKKT